MAPPFGSQRSDGELAGAGRFVSPRSLDRLIDSMSQIQAMMTTSPTIQPIRTLAYSFIRKPLTYHKKRLKKRLEPLASSISGTCNIQPDR